MRFAFRISKHTKRAFAMKLIAYLKQKKMTAPAFAKKAGLTIYAVNKYKYGTRTPRRPNLLKIMKATKNEVSAKDWY